MISDLFTLVDERFHVFIFNSIENMKISSGGKINIALDRDKK